MKWLLDLMRDFRRFKMQISASKTLKNFKNKLVENKFTRQEILQSTFKELSTSLIYVGMPAFLTALLEPVFGSEDKIFGMSSVAKGLVIGGVAALGDAGKTICEKWESKKSTYYYELTSVIDSPKYQKFHILICRIHLINILMIDI